MAKLIIEGEQRFLEKVAKQLRSNKKVKVSKESFESVEGNADESSVSPTTTDETSGGGAKDMTTDNFFKSKKGKK